MAQQVTLKQVFEAIYEGQNLYSKAYTSHNYTYESMADEYMKTICHLDTPTEEDGLGGVIYQEYRTKKMNYQISSKQAWCIAFAFKKANPTLVI